MDQEVSDWVCVQVNMWPSGDLREEGGVLTDTSKMCFTGGEGGRGLGFFTDGALKIIRLY